MAPAITDLERVAGEIRAILNILEPLTGLTSHWTGELRLESLLREKGTKPFSCEIVIRADLASDPVRWRTLIHEALHSISGGYTPLDFIAHRGWEEGVVEQTQRLLRTEILTTIGVNVSDELFIEAEINHPFDGYISCLERIRNGFGLEARAFYFDLLRMPIKQRYQSLQERAMLLGPADRARMVRLLSETNAVLTRKALP